MPTAAWAMPCSKRTTLTGRFANSKPPSSAASVSALIADINAANKAGGANTITLTAPTTSPYALTAVNNRSFVGPNGLPVIAAKDNLTIVGNGDTIEPSSKALQPFRFFQVAAGASLTLDNLTLQGRYPGIREGGLYRLNPILYGPTQGGAIYSQGALTLNDTLLEGNLAEGSFEGGYLGGYGAAGGAVYIAGGTANISNATFSHNVAYGVNVAYSSEYPWGGGATTAPIPTAAPFTSPPDRSLLRTPP